MFINKYYRKLFIFIFLIPLFIFGNNIFAQLQAPIINYPSGASNERVDTFGNFNWVQSEGIETYAIILTPKGSNGTVVFYTQTSSMPCQQTEEADCIYWPYPALSYNSDYTLSVQECLRQDISSCGSATIISFKTVSRPISALETTETGSEETSGNNSSNNPINLFNSIASVDIQDLFGAITNFLFVLALGVGPLMIIYAGYMILTAGGDAQKMSRAKTIILWTVIALAVIFFAKGLTSLVQGILA